MESVVAADVAATVLDASTDEESATALDDEVDWLLDDSVEVAPNTLFSSASPPSVLVGVVSETDTEGTTEEVAERLSVDAEISPEDVSERVESAVDEATGASVEDAGAIEEVTGTSVEEAMIEEEVASSTEEDSFFLPSLDVADGVGVESTPARETLFEAGAGLGSAEDPESTVELPPFLSPFSLLPSP